MYNVLLAKESKRMELYEKRREQFREWEREVQVDLEGVSAWVRNPHGFWMTIAGQDHTVTPLTKMFV